MTTPNPSANAESENPAFGGQEAVVDPNVPSTVTQGELDPVDVTPVAEATATEQGIVVPDALPNTDPGTTG